MNNERRSKLRGIAKTLQACLDRIDDIAVDEQEAMDNTPEGLQESDRFASMEEALENLEDAKTSLEETIEKIESAITC